jgi:hypothetical protein
MSVSFLCCTHKGAGKMQIFMKIPKKLDEGRIVLTSLNMVFHTCNSGYLGGREKVSETLKNKLDVMAEPVVPTTWEAEIGGS